MWKHAPSSAEPPTQVFDKPTTPMKTLILGYGNNSRRDDGVGWFVLDQLAPLALPETDLLAAQQLEIELAETFTGYERIIFIDASIPETPDALQRTEVTPQYQSHAVAHFLTPPDLLSLCETLYQHRPEALLFSIRGSDFNFGETLTPQTEQAAREAVQQILDEVNGRTQPS